jgi:hypothetical protein
MLDMRTLLRATAAVAGTLMMMLAASPSAADILDDADAQDHGEVLNFS